MSAFLKRVEFGLQTNYRTNDTNLSLIKFELRILKVKQRKDSQLPCCGNGEILMSVILIRMRLS